MIFLEFNRFQANRRCTIDFCIRQQTDKAFALKLELVEQQISRAFQNASIEADL